LRDNEGSMLASPKTTTERFSRWIHFTEYEACCSEGHIISTQGQVSLRPPLSETGRDVFIPGFLSIVEVVLELYWDYSMPDSSINVHLRLPFEHYLL